MSVYDEIKRLGYTLPTPPKPVAAYIPWVRSGNLVFISGQVPFVDGKLSHQGTVPNQVSVEQAIEAARICALNLLSVLHDATDEDLDRVARVVRLGVFVASEPGFHAQPKVGNGASELMVEVFGERGRHVRAAVGSVALPLGVPVEVEGTFELRT